MPGRMGVYLLIDTVSLGWYGFLRVLKHVISFISRIQARTGVIRNIRSRFCSETDLELHLIPYLKFSKFNDDKWKQLPALIMIGNGTFWALMISLDLVGLKYYQHNVLQHCYGFKKMRIQTDLLDLLRDLPVCVGLGVKGDVHDIEQFYTEV